VTGIAGLMGSVAALLWVAFAFFAALLVRGLLVRNHGPLTRLDTPRTNPDALRLLHANRYDVVISDVSRDDEGPGSNLKGLDFADEVFASTGLRVLLFTARFNPATYPGATDAERLALVRRVQRAVFASTNRMDEALHYVMDVLER
jgi:hypothetical protein